MYRLSLWRNMRGYEQSHTSFWVVELPTILGRPSIAILLLSAGLAAVHELLLYLSIARSSAVIRTTKCYA